MTGISVNGVEIPQAAIAAEAQNNPADSPQQAWDMAARALTLRELLLQEAREQKLKPMDMRDKSDRKLTQDDALIEALLVQEVKIPEADATACRRYYDNNQEHFRSPDLYEAAHILLAASPDDDHAYHEAVARAEEIIAELTEHPQRFAALAQAHSRCPSAKTGGNLGQIAKGQTVPEFETFLFALEEGQLCSTPVKTRFGVHVIRLERRISGRLLGFEMVAEKIADYLEEASYRRAVSQYLHILAGRAKITGIDLDAALSPLVQ